MVEKETLKKIGIASIVIVVVAVAIVVPVVLLTGKSSSNSNRILLNIPPLQPPVIAATPASLRSAAAAQSSSKNQLQAVTTASIISQIKSRMFGPGPTDFIYRLGQIDSRMQSTIQRNNEGSGRKCLADAPVSWSPSFFLPASASFPMWFQCQETMSGASGLRVYFGVQNNVSYIAELQLSPRIAVLAHISNDGNNVQAWQIVAGSNASSPVSYFQIIADRSAQAIEVSTASLDGPATDIGCGVRLRTSSSYVYSIGEFTDPSIAAPSQSCLGSTSPRFTSACASASSLNATVSSNCAAIQSFSVQNFTYSDLNSGGYASKAFNAISAPGIPTVVDFNTLI